MYDEEYFQILQELEKHHALFSRFWSIGKLVEDAHMPCKTACVVFDQYGDGLLFKVNPEFWASLELKAKVFVLGHECLHVYLEHGRRMQHLGNRQVANIAADVVVNHYLEDAFGFSRNDLKDWKIACWLETVFPNDPTVLPHKSLEYYFALLMKDAKASKKPGGEPQTIDDHEQMPQITEQEMDEILSRISPEEMKEFEEKINGNPEEIAKAKQAGSTAGHMIQRIHLLSIVKKRKWETIIKDVLGRFVGKERDVTIEQWAHKSRRMATIDSHSMMLPSDMDDVVPVRDRVDVWFFQDTSGSCTHLAERFFKAAASLPDDKFLVRLFCFDTKVRETTIKSGKVYGGGGTCFRVMEEHIQELIKTEPKTKYPSIVFVVTDGYGSNVTPEHANRWHWFLTEDSSKNQIPTGSKIWELKNFE